MEKQKKTSKEVEKVILGPIAPLTPPDPAFSTPAQPPKNADFTPTSRYTTADHFPTLGKWTIHFNDSTGSQYLLTTVRGQ